MRKPLSVIVYLLFRLGVGSMRIIPMPVLYLLSDGTAWLLRDIVRYRRRIVDDNLLRCFPELSADGRRQLTRDFYSALADWFLEGIKGFTMSREALMARYRVVNPAILDQHLREGRSVLLAGSHLNNWEWGVLIYNQWFGHQVCGVYQVVSNPYIHRFLMRRRARFGMQLISARNAVQQIVSLPDPVAAMVLSDQSPVNMKYAIWTEFLGRRTPCLHGLEAMARKTGFPVYYYEVTRPARGYYETRLHLLTDDPASLPPDAITIRYMHLLEASIRRAPSRWLWSHRRWKRA